MSRQSGPSPVSKPRLTLTPLDAPPAFRLGRGFTSALASPPARGREVAVALTSTLFSVRRHSQGPRAHAHGLIWDCMEFYGRQWSLKEIVRTPCGYDLA